MARSNVLKILYVLELLKRTDEKHPINTTQIIEALGKEGFEAENKAIGHYIKALREEMGYQIVLSKNRNLGWYMIEQEFMDYELKMLADAVASAGFLSAEDSYALIAKIKHLATKEGERIIGATSVLDPTLKLVDEQHAMKFAVKFDLVMQAIANHRKIRFEYEDLGVGNKRYAKEEGKIYEITPYYLGVWGKEYFVIANTEPYDNVSAYRVEMMKKVQETALPARPMAEITELSGIGSGGKSWGDFFKRYVNLQSGEVKTIRLCGENHLRREVMKRFGNDLMIRDYGKELFRVNVTVADSEGFYQWLASYGTRLRIEGPKESREQFKEFLAKTLEQYE